MSTTGESSLPSAMQALELRAYDGQLHPVEKSVPRPGSGRLLIRMAAAPINPSDVMFLRGLYGVRKPLPVVPGFEGSGTVVAAGPHVRMRRFWLGRRVGCIAPDDGDGTWAEYMVTEVRRCVPLRKSVTLEQGATLFVNPWTAWALIDMARSGRHKAVAHTAAASSLGRMLLRLGHHFDVPILHIVRRREQVDLLSSLGARHVLNSSDADFDGQYRKMCRQLGVSLAFDAVAGEMTGRLLAGMVPGGRVIVYGGLSEQMCTIHPAQLIFERKRVEGFWLSDWVQHGGLIRMLRTASAIQKRLAGDLRTEIRARVPIDQAPVALQSYMQEMTKGKTLIVPGERRHE